MLSICIPAYTYVDYTAEAVSALLKEPEDFELIVLEDFDLANTGADMARRIDHARELLRSDPRVVWRRNDAPLAIQDNWNRGVSLATRPYVKLMGADDRICPGGIARIEAMLRAQPKVQFHGHLARIIDETGRVVRLQRPYRRSGTPLLCAGADALRLKLQQVARFKEPACNVYTRQTWEQVGGYSGRYRFCFDIEFNVRVMRGHDCCLWSEYAVDLRRHAASDGARLPAELALRDLRALVDDVYRFLGSNLSPADRVYGEAWVSYRMIELALARYRRNPRELLAFLAAHREAVDLSPATLRESAAILARRAVFRDVQRALP